MKNIVSVNAVDSHEITENNDINTLITLSCQCIMDWLVTF
jgi:hypothetical protein